METDEKKQPGEEPTSKHHHTPHGKKQESRPRDTPQPPEQQPAATPPVPPDANNQAATPKSLAEAGEQAEAGEVSTSDTQNVRDAVAKMSDEELVAVLQKAQEAAFYFEALQRTTADYDNLHKRTEKERESSLKYANQSLARELLRIGDVFEKALATSQTISQSPDQATKAFVEGMRLVHQELTKILRQFNIVPMDAVGKKFDPRYHEAIMQKECDTKPEMTILEELEKGYMLHDRVLRVSKVVVSRKPQPKEKAAAEAQPPSPQPEPKSEAKPSSKPETTAQ